MKPQSGNNLTHSILSASASHRWAKCPASAYWSHVKGSSAPAFAAREGTGLHSLLETALLEGRNAESFKYVVIADDAGTPEAVKITEEQKDVLREALDYIRAIGGNVQAEQRIFYGEELGVSDDVAFGTGDVTIVAPNDFGGVNLHIVDLKTGRTPVRAERNSQLALYAAGALRELELVEDVAEVHLHIIQPRIFGGSNVWVTTPAEIADFVAAMREPAKRVIEIIDQSKLTEGYTPPDDAYQPDADGCTFCPAANNPCAAQMKLAHDTVMQMFDDAEISDGGKVAKESADDMTAERLGEVLEMADILEPFFATVREESMRRAVMGEKIKGHKVVRVRAGSKKWADVETAWRELPKILPNQNLAKPVELRTPADLLKLDTVKTKRGDDGETQARKAELQAAILALVVQAEDARSLVRDSDPRGAWSPRNVAQAEDFDDLDLT